MKILIARYFNYVSKVRSMPQNRRRRHQIVTVFAFSASFGIFGTLLSRKTGFEPFFYFFFIFGVVLGLLAEASMNPRSEG